MNTRVKKTLIFLLHAFIGWALCGAAMGVGLSVTTEANATIAHAVLAPVFFAIVSFVYHRKFNYTPPLLTAVLFVCFILAMDAGMVSPVFVKNYGMFSSFLGLWLPVMLIFAATVLAGTAARKRG